MATNRKIVLIGLGITTQYEPPVTSVDKYFDIIHDKQFGSLDFPL